MTYLKQNIFSADRQKVRENCKLFNFFEQRGRATTAVYHDFFNRAELSYDDFSSLCEKIWEEIYNYIAIDKYKNKNINCRLRINWNWRVL